MTPGEAASWGEIVNGVSVAVLLALAVVGAVREWWVPGAVHRRQLSEAAERERQWRELALRGSGIAAGALDVARGRAGDGNDAG